MIKNCLLLTINSLFFSFIFLNILISCVGQTTVSTNDNNNNPPIKTIWTGPKITFTKADGADPSLEANQDRITANVWITRENTGGQIFNIKTETSSTKSSSPSDTEWSLGTTANLDTLTFQPFRTAVGKPKNTINQNLVLHLITDNIYIDIKITDWSLGKTSGGFSYERSTPTP